MFDRLVHADWSALLPKRWVAVAERRDHGWCVECPLPVGPSTDFLNREIALARHQRTLLGFDFPIGLPVAYGERTGFSRFTEALAAFGREPWDQFFNVAAFPEEISVRRPFYPQASRSGAKQAALTAALRVQSMDQLLRECERKTERTRAACCLFWTLGGNQVGKAAIAGWQEIIRPAMKRGAWLWPFDGDLAKLASAPGLVIAETYPAIGYPLMGAGFGAGESKRRQADRKSKSAPILVWANRHGVRLSEQACGAVRDGFGPSEAGEDAFDAFVGLLKMIEVADERQPEGAGAHLAWEGWILGR